MHSSLKSTTAAILFILMGHNSVSAQAPLWWQESSVLLPGVAPDDYATMNIGQLKFLAWKAAEQMDAKLPGGAGIQVRQMVDRWMTTEAVALADDYAAANLGQLKAAARPIYDRLIELGVITAYPWSLTTDDDDDYTLVNLGQAKWTFSFPLSGINVPPPADSGDGSPILPFPGENEDGLTASSAPPPAPGAPALQLDTSITWPGVYFYSTTAEGKAYATGFNAVNPGGTDSYYAKRTGKRDMKIPKQSHNKTVVYEDKKVQGIKPNSYRTTKTTNLQAGEHTESWLESYEDLCTDPIISSRDESQNTNPLLRFKYQKSWSYLLNCSRKETVTKEEKWHGDKDKYFDDWGPVHPDPGNPAMLYSRYWGDETQTRLRIAENKLQRQITGTSAAGTQAGGVQWGALQQNSMNQDQIQGKLTDKLSWAYKWNWKRMVSTNRYEYYPQPITTPSYPKPVSKEQPVISIPSPVPFYLPMYGEANWPRCTYFYWGEKNEKTTDTPTSKITTYDVVNSTTKAIISGSSDRREEKVEQPVLASQVYQEFLSDLSAKAWDSWRHQEVSWSNYVSETAAYSREDPNPAGTGFYYHQAYKVAWSLAYQTPLSYTPQQIAQLSPAKITVTYTYRDKNWNTVQTLTQPYFLAPNQQLSVSVADPTLLVPNGGGVEISATADYIDIPIEALSRDKFLAGSVSIPQGFDSLSLEFVNSNSGENLGRYSSLLGGGAKVFASIPAILENGTTEQPPAQKVWFVRNSDDSRKIDFFTCFRNLGQIEVRAYLPGLNSPAKKVTHTLVAESKFADWINYVDDWITGDGFNWNVPPTVVPAAMQALASQIAANGNNVTSAEATNALIAGAILTSESDLEIEAAASGPITPGPPITGISELGDLSAVKALPIEGWSLPPEITTEAGTAYWLSGTTLTPLSAEQLSALVPQAGGITLAAPPPTIAANNAASSAGNSNGELHPLTRAALIPIFLVITQVEGAEALAYGLYDGCKTGLTDDYEMWATLGAAGGQIALRANQEIMAWRANPEMRAAVFMGMTMILCQEHIFKPLQEAGGSLASSFSSWSSFKRSAWISLRTFSAAHVWGFTVLAQDIGPWMAKSLVEWYDDFGNRMVEGSGNSVFGSAPWRQDLLAASFVTVERAAIYAVSYTAGYMIEQVAVGALTGGIGKAGLLLAKGGVNLTAQLAKRTAFAVATKGRALKEAVKDAATWAAKSSQWGAININAQNAAKKRVNGAIDQCAAELIKKPHLKKILDRAFEFPKLNRLAKEGGDALYDRLGLLHKLLGDELDETLVDNFLKVMEHKLIHEADGKVVDWGEDFLRCFRHNPSEFSSRAAFSELDDNGKAFLKQFLSDPDAGDMWKLPEWPDQHEKYWIRGLVGELEMWHKKYAREGFSHLPNATAFDFQNAATKVSIQNKTVQTVNAGSIQRMKTAINDMLASGNAPSDHILVLEVLLKPDSGNAEVLMRETLQTFLNDIPNGGGARIRLEIREHVFGQ